MIKRSTLMSKSAVKREMQRFPGFQSKKESAGVAKHEVGAGNTKPRHSQEVSFFKMDAMETQLEAGSIKKTTETQRSSCKLCALCVSVVNNVKLSTIHVQGELMPSFDEGLSRKVPELWRMPLSCTYVVQLWRPTRLFRRGAVYRLGDSAWNCQFSNSSRFQRSITQ